MSKFSQGSGGKTARCLSTTILMITFMVMAFSGSAQAAGHGVTIEKVCTGPVRTCDSNVDCPSDNLCLPQKCDLDIPDTMSCDYTVTNADSFEDTLNVVHAWDTVDPFPGSNTRVPAAPDDSPIVAINGNARCTDDATGALAVDGVGDPLIGGGDTIAYTAVLPCVIGPDNGPGLGAITFLQNTYEPTDTDPTPLADRITVQVQDQCNTGTDPDNCDDQLVSDVSFSASTRLVDGCIPDTPVTCDPDSDLCDVEYCDSTDGFCKSLPPTVCDPDDDLCDVEACDSTDGFCKSLPPTVCDPDDDLCDVEACDSTDGFCKSLPPTVCDPDDDLCDVEACDSTDGFCKSLPPTVCDPDDDLCDVEACDSTDGFCKSLPPTVCDPDDDLCDVEACDSTDGFCKSLPPTVCDPDDDLCDVEACDSTDGFCKSLPPTVCDPDDDLCDVEACDSTDGFCKSLPPTVCDPDDDLCDVEACDSTDGFCKSLPPTVCDPDDDLCDVEACDSTDGFCKSLPPTVCDPDDDLCDVEACDSTDGFCKSLPPTVCDPDDDLCDVEACDSTDGFCKSLPPTVCDPDDDLCDVEACDSTDGFCKSLPPTVCDPDDDLCDVEACDSTDGFCKSLPPTVCDPDDDLCDVEACDSTDGFCKSLPPTVCDQDDDLCDVEACDSTDGFCKSLPPITCDDDLCELCDSTTGECEVDEEDLDCQGYEICRTPGFWATHAGTEKGSKSNNITQAVINKGEVCDEFDSCVTGLSVCGVIIDNTSDLEMNPAWDGNAFRETSSTEAMCVAVRGDSNRQLVRQLTAFALNCVMSGGNGDCVGTGPYLSELAEECNAVCADGENGGRSVNDCIHEIDTFNNGLFWDGSGPSPHLGECSGDGLDCTADEDCAPVVTGPAQTCDNIPESCHERDLCAEFDEELCWDKPGPAGSSGACKIAKKNNIYVAD